jgi:hypothetical protein
MRITRRQLKRIIREQVEASGRPSGPDYVASMLDGQAQGPGKGFTFGELAMDAVADGDLRKAANKVMDALWVDDPWPEDEQALEDMLAQAKTVEDVAAIGADWLDGFRAGAYTSENQKMANLNQRSGGRSQG